MSLSKDLHKIYTSLNFLFLNKQLKDKPLHQIVKIEKNLQVVRRFREKNLFRQI